MGGSMSHRNDTYQSAPNLKGKNRKKVNWKFKNSMIPAEPEKRESIHVDWLGDQR